MKLLVASSSPPDRGSGINAYVNELCRALIDQGAQIHYMSPPPTDWTWLRSLGIDHVRVDQFDDPRDAARRSIEYVKDHNIDASINNDNAILQSILPAMPCPVVSVGHMGRTSVASLACHNSRWSDYVVAISYDMQRVFTHRYGVPLWKCPVVHNGVTDPGHAGTYANKDPEMLRIVFAGGPSRNKGGALVVAAIRKANARRAKVHVDWFSAVRRSVALKAAELPNVTLHGRVPRTEFLEHLREADVFLLPSRAEGCPMAMLEAMSLGVAPVASDGIGAMRWLVTSGREGFICSLDAWAEQAAECIAYLAAHPGVVEDMKRATRERFLRDFQSDRVATDLVRLLQRPTVDRRKPRGRIRVLRWHRPLRPDGKKAPLVDRICIRTGLLRSAGTIDI